MKNVIWTDARFYTETTCTEDKLFIDNAEGRIVVFFCGQIGFHTGTYDLFEEARPHNMVSAYAAIKMLDGIIEHAVEEDEELRNVKDLRHEIALYANDLNEEELKVIACVEKMLKRRGVHYINDIRKDTMTKLIFEFEIPAPRRMGGDEYLAYAENRLYRLVDNLNEVAAAKNSKIKFSPVFYDYSGAYPNGIGVDW